MNILVPLAGKDTAFLEAFGQIKPFVKIKGKSLIELTLKRLSFDFKNLIFVGLKEYDNKFKMGKKLYSIFGDNIKIVWTERVTDGCAASCLLAKEYIDNEDELLIYLGDIYFTNIDPLKFDIKNHKEDIAGIIPVVHRKISDRAWGYVYLDDKGKVREVKEKETNPLSINATVGLYYFRKGREFVKYISQMIEANDRVSYNNLFYVGPVYNYFIKDSKKISISKLEDIFILGTPQDIKDFQKH